MPLAYVTAAAFESGLPGSVSRRRSGRPALIAVALAFATLLSAPSAVAYASVHQQKEHKRDAKREIETVEEQWRQAQLAGDVSVMDKLLADDYFGISVAGQFNDKAQQLDRLRNRTLLLTTIDVSDVKIKLLGRVAIVTSFARLEGTNDGASMKGNYRYTRIYKRYADGSWKITNFEVTRVPDGSSGKLPVE